jgi:hypothetical protein
MARKDELRAVHEAHRAAQARIGLAAAFLALDRWGTVSAISPRSTSRGWIDAAIRAIYAARIKSARLARAYYQLVRALETGRTLGGPDGQEDARAVGLRELREQFAEQVQAAAKFEAGRSGDVDEDWLDAELRELGDADDVGGSRKLRLSDTDLADYLKDLERSSGSDDPRITVDRFDWPTDLDQAQVRSRFERGLERIAVGGQERNVRLYRQEAEDAQERALRKLEEEHQLSGSKGAAGVDYGGISAGREQIDQAMRFDRRVVGVARGLGPNPCAFCSMLASRGFVYSPAAAMTTTRSKTVAGNFVGDQVRKYHVNCHCYPIVTFSRQPVLPAENARLQKLWADKIAPRRLPPKEARNEWRKLLNAERRTPADAQPVLASSEP